MTEVPVATLSLAQQLERLDPRFMPAPFWFWNDRLEPDEVRRQVREMAARHFGGFFMHARMGRITPYMSDEWMSAIRAAVEEARETGLAAWLYDEDGWPSGYAGGVVNAQGPEYLQPYALGEIVSRGQQDASVIPDAGKLIAAFIARRTATGFEVIKRLEASADGIGLPSSCRSDGDCLILFRREVHGYRRYFSPESWADGYVDVLNPKVTRAFIDAVHERYRQEIGEHFGTVVPGVFTDEPSYHDHGWATNDVRLPYSPLLADEFANRYGSPLVDSLALIAFGGPDAIRARWCYYTALAHLFVQSYTRVLAEWCEHHGLLFTGHYLLEESPRAATQVVGDVMQHYALQDIPGIDHLGKPLDLREFWSSARVLVKQAASVAHQLDKPQVLCETFAGGGWDFGPLEQKWMGDWQYALGLSLLCPHAMHYSLRGLRKRDYPPSFSFQQPWWTMSGDLGAHFARLGKLLTQGRRVVNVLILHPIESFFATHDVAGFPWADDPLHDALKRLVRGLLDHQIDFDFGNEVLLQEHGHVDGSQVVMGSARYNIVIVPHSITWRQLTVDLLREFIANHGSLYCIEPLPTHVEAVPSKTLAPLLAAATNLGRWNEPEFEGRLVREIRNASRSACRLVGSEPRDRDVLVMHRRAADHDIFFLATAATEPHESVAEFEVSGTPLLLDTVTGDLQPMHHAREGSICRVRLPFDHGRSFPIIFDRTRGAAAPAESCILRKVLCHSETALPYTLSRPNALLLDRAELKIDGRSAGSILVIDTAGKLQTQGAPGKQVTLRFTVRCDRRVPDAWLLCETPERFEITVNGHPLDGWGSGEWFVDPCLHRLPIPRGLSEGENVVSITCRWDASLEIEPLYVLGEFGVYEETGECWIGNLPVHLRMGSWDRQGLAFYAGSVTYHLAVEVDEAADRWELYCPQYRSSVNIRVNDQEAGTLLWAPNRLDVTRLVQPGHNRIDLEVANSLRNFLGPHHLSNEDEIECLSPGDFFSTSHRSEAYRFKPAGLLGEVVLYGCKRVHNGADTNRST